MQFQLKFYLISKHHIHTVVAVALHFEKKNFFLFLIQKKCLFVVEMHFAENAIFYSEKRSLKCQQTNKLGRKYNNLGHRVLRNLFAFICS